MGTNPIQEIFAYSIAAGVIVAIVFVIHKFKSTELDVKVMSDTIIFKTAKNTLALAPYICVSNDRKRKRVLSVGLQESPKEPHIMVNLTKYAGEAGGEREYYECLSTFFRYAFCKLINRNFFVLPKVSLSGVDILTSNFPNSNTKPIFKALKQAGAIQSKIV